MGLDRPEQEGQGIRLIVVGVSRQRAYRLMEAHGPVDLDALRTGRR